MLFESESRRYNDRSVNVSSHCISQRDMLMSRRILMSFKDYRREDYSLDKLSSIFPTFHPKIN